MVELLVFCLVGCAYGLVIGLLPGASMSVGMVLSYPLLMKCAPHDVIAFYISMATSVQYFGGASATLLGIPTELTCLPSVKEGYGLVNRGKVSEALSSGVLSSFIGSMIAIVLTLAIFWIGNNYSLLFNFKFQLALLLLTCAITVASHRNIITGIALLGSGYFLGMVGVNQITRKPFMTFDIPQLVGGIPLIVVLVFLYGLPLLLSINYTKTTINIREKLKLQLVVPLVTIIRSSIIGFVCGFIPMLGIILSSNLSYSLTKFLHRSDYDHGGDVRGLASSDAGHNAGLVASLVPLFCFGVPILTSEYILYDITTNRGLTYNLEWLLHNYWWIFGIFAVSNIFGFITSWPLAIHLVKFIINYMNLFKVFGISLMLISVLLIATNLNQLGFYVILSLIFLPIGYALRRIDMLPFILGFLISQQFDSTLRIVYNLHFGG